MGSVNEGGVWIFQNTNRPTSSFWYRVSPEDAEFSRSHVWSLTGDPRWNRYATRKAKISDGAPSGAYGRRVIKLHREILKRSLGDQPDLLADHINGDTLDNRRENLRWTTYSENSQNQRRQERTKHRPKGIVFRRDCPSRPWHSYGRINGKVVWLGSYATQEEAGAVSLKWRRDNLPFFTER